MSPSLGTHAAPVVQPQTRTQSRLLPGFLVLLSIAGAVHCGRETPDRRLSIHDLRLRPTEENVLSLRWLLAQGDRDMRATALSALVGLEVKDAAELALAALADGDGYVRAMAAKLLGDLADPRYADALARSLLEDSDPIARQRAAESLAVLGGAVALEALARGLGDPMGRVRMACVAGLGARDPAFASAEIERLLAEDADWEVRAEAARALGSTGDPAVLPALAAAAGDPNEFVRSAAAQAIKTDAELPRRRPAAEPASPPS